MFSLLYSCTSNIDNLRKYTGKQLSVQWWIQDFPEVASTPELGMKSYYYRPQRSWAKVMFLQASVILSTGRGCLPQCMMGYHPPGADTPLQEQTPPHGADTPPSRHPLEQTPPRADTPGSRHPLKQTPPGADTPPQSRHPQLWSRHPPEADTPPGADTSPQKQTPPPLREADSGVGSTSGRYASYWNAFLFGQFFSRKLHKNGINWNESGCAFPVLSPWICHRCLQKIFFGLLLSP